MAASQVRPAPYDGEDLGPHPHVAVIFRDQLGDFTVATPLLRGLRERYPDVALDYFGGEKTREIEEASRLIDSRFSLFGQPDALAALETYLDARRAVAGPYALAINLESAPEAAQAAGLAAPRYIAGPFVDPLSQERIPPPALGIDRLWHEIWNRPDLRADYPELTSQYIGEIFCRLARVETDYRRTEVPQAPPPFATPPFLVATGASRPAKLWPADYWRQIATWRRERQVDAGLLGAPPQVQRASFHSSEVDDLLIASGFQDLRGRLTLPEVAGALARTHAFLTIDSGLMHLAGAVHTPTIALLGASPLRIWAPPGQSIRILEPSDPCPRCEENRFRNADCLLPVHQCMRSVEPARVIAAVEALLAT